MVNTGRPSTGCALCKKRKIKCDERRPHCLRCEKINKPCPGVPAPLDHVFRLGGRSNSLSKRHASPMQGSSRDQQAEPADASNDGPDAGSSLRRQPSLSLENQGVMLFFKDVVMAPHNSALGSFLSCLPTVYGAASPSSPLRFAVAANAVTTLRACRPSPALDAAALWHYGQTLEAMRTAMADPRRVRHDDVLMTVMLLKLFEQNQAGIAKSIVGYKSHTTAAAALLVRRGDAQFADASSLRLFRAIRWHIFMASVQFSHYPDTLYSTSFDWFADRAIPDEHAETSRLAAAAWLLPLLRARATALLTRPPHEQSESALLELQSDAEALDDGLALWHTALTERWRPRLRLLPYADPAAADSWHGAAHDYASARAACALNVYRVLRLMALGIALRCADALRDVPRFSAPATTPDPMSDPFGFGALADEIERDDDLTHEFGGNDFGDADVDFDLGFAGLDASTVDEDAAFLPSAPTSDAGTAPSGLGLAFALNDNDASDPPAARRARAEIAHLVDDVCASVPWFLHRWPAELGGRVVGVGAANEDGTRRDRARSGSSTISASAKKGKGSPAATQDAEARKRALRDPDGAYHLLWPLFVAGSVHTVPLEQRSWCAARLRSIAFERGLPQAGGMADALRV